MTSFPTVRRKQRWRGRLLKMWLMISATKDPATTASTLSQGKEKTSSCGWWSLLKVQASSSWFKTSIPQTRWNSLEIVSNTVDPYCPSTNLLTPNPTCKWWRKCSSTRSTLQRTTPSLSPLSTTFFHSTTTMEECGSECIKLSISMKKSSLKLMTLKSWHLSKSDPDSVCSQLRHSMELWVEKHCGKTVTTSLQAKWDLESTMRLSSDEMRKSRERRSKTKLSRKEETQMATLLMPLSEISTDLP